MTSGKARVNGRFRACGDGSWRRDSKVSRARICCADHVSCARGGREPLVRERFASVRQTFAWVRDAFAWVRDAFASVLMPLAWMRESLASVCEPFAGNARGREVPLRLERPVHMASASHEHERPKPSSRALEPASLALVVRKQASPSLSKVVASAESRVINHKGARTRNDP